MTDYSVHTLEAVVRQRLADPDAASYSRKLAGKGVDKCAEKLGEEAVETVIAAVQRDATALTAETADLVFHLTVLLTVSGISWDDVMAELARRADRSGLEEKASRQS